MYGDTEVMRHRVDRLRDQAEDIRTTADQLVARSEGVAWTGRAADAMRSRIRERAVSLRSVAARHDSAADALERHLVEVDRLKEAIASTERRAAALLADGSLSDFTPPAPGHKDWLEAPIS